MRNARQGINWAGLALSIGSVGACATLASCSAGPVPPLEGSVYSAVQYEPTGHRWDILSTGSLEVLGAECLAVRLGDSFGDDALPHVVALPTGSRLASDGTVELPNGTRVALGDTFSFTQEPFHGTVNDLPTESPRVSAAPPSCPAEANVILLVPLGPE